MRRWLIVFAAVAFCSIPTWADSIELDVTAFATFTATQPCSSNCTETIGVNFLYLPPVHGNGTGSLQNLLGSIVRGTEVVSSSWRA
jgi:hypothetical protein